MKRALPLALVARGRAAFYTIMRFFKHTSVRILALILLSLAVTSLIIAWLNPSPVVVVAKDSRKHPGDELLTLIFDHARNGTTEAVKMYLDTGYTPNIISPRGDSLLIVSAYHGYPDLVKLVLAQPNVPVDFQNKMGFTALTGASFKGYTDIMQQLIAAGATVNHRNMSGQTALMFASLTGRFDAVKLLLNNGANAKVKDTSGNDAAALAAQQGADDVSAVLVAHP